MTKALLERKSSDGLPNAWDGAQLLPWPTVVMGGLLQCTWKVVLGHCWQATSIGIRTSTMWKPLQNSSKKAACCCPSPACWPVLSGSQWGWRGRRWTGPRAGQPSAEGVGWGVVGWAGTSASTWEKALFTAHPEVVCPTQSYRGRPV